MCIKLHVPISKISVGLLFPNGNKKLFNGLRYHRPDGSDIRNFSAIGELSFGRMFGKSLMYSGPTNVTVMSE